MSNTEDRRIIIVLGPRHLVAGGLAVITLVVLTSISVYVIGHVFRPTSAVARAGAPAEQILVIDGSGEITRQASPPEGEAVLAGDSPLAAEGNSYAGCEGDPETFFGAPAIGDLYLQVAAANRGVAGIFAIYLDQKGVPVVVSEAPEADTYRVLAGPLPHSGVTAATKAKLEGLGFQPFLRRIREGQ